MDIVHTGYLALVDAKGRLRGIFRPEDPGLDELFHRAMQVRRERR